MITFEIPGQCVAKGSMKAFWNPRARKIVTMATNRDKQIPWASKVFDAAMVAMKGKPKFEGSVLIEARFYMPRPKSHFGTSGLKSSAPEWHTVRPDCDKLLRQIFDSLTGVCWRDDSQAVLIMATKKYGDDFVGVRIGIDEVTSHEYGRIK